VHGSVGRIVDNSKGRRARGVVPDTKRDLIDMIRFTPDAGPEPFNCVET
jgi:hypothetical protein